MTHTPPDEVLTPKQVSVLAALAEGLEYEEVARRLLMSLSAVKLHAHEARQRLGARNTAHAVARGYEQGVIGRPLDIPPCTHRADLCPPITEGAEMTAVKDLARTIARIEAVDANYPVRYSLVLRAMYLADASGYATGYRIDPNEPEWPVAYIYLPEGQISWHMPQYPDAWDGHTTETKYERIRKFVERVNPFKKVKP